jgi:hypothetical protein
VIKHLISDLEAAQKEVDEEMDEVRRKELIEKYNHGGRPCGRSWPG